MLMLQFPEPCDTGRDHRAWLLCVLLTPFYAFVTRICWPIDWVWQCSFLSHLTEEFVKRWHYFPLFDFSFERTNLAISSFSQIMANIPSFPVTKTHLHDPSPMSSSMTLHLCLPQWHFTYPTSMTLSITSHLNDTLSELTQLRDKSFKRPCQCVRGQVATPCCYILCFCCPLWMWPCWGWRLQCPLPIVPWSTQHTAARKRAALYKIKCSKKSL